jgi:hypothetical protein
LWQLQLLTASPTDVAGTYMTVSGHGLTAGQVNFIPSAIQNFVGTLHIVASVSDGNVATKAFPNSSLRSNLPLRCAGDRAA